MILLSPITSGFKIALKKDEVDEDFKSMDVFCNDEKIENVIAPVFIIHGKQDDLIKFSQCKNMSKKVKKLREWYPAEGNHNNIITRYRFKFYQNVKNFIDIINETNNDNQSSDCFNNGHYMNFSFHSNIVASENNNGNYLQKGNSNEYFEKVKKDKNERERIEKNENNRFHLNYNNSNIHHHVIQNYSTNNSIMSRKKSSIDEVGLKYGTERKDTGITNNEKIQSSLDVKKLSMSSTNLMKNNLK